MGGMSSYQRKKEKIKELEDRLFKLSNKYQDLYMSVRHAKERIGEDLGICPFMYLEGNVEHPIITDRETLLGIIKGIRL